MTTQEQEEVLYFSMRDLAKKCASIITDIVESEKQKLAEDHKKILCERVTVKLKEEFCHQIDFGFLAEEIKRQCSNK